MKNIFMDQSSHRFFSWDKLGDIKAGRSDLGEDMPVLIYRLLEYSMNHVLSEEFGAEKANELFRKTGYLAGCEFSKNMLDLSQNLSGVVAQIQKIFRELRIGILRVESISESCDQIILTVAQDLDCSGLPPTNEVVCNYDEGFIAGILETYTKKPYLVREIDCWASGDRVCRFRCVAKEPSSTSEAEH